ncbi:hypothetical protein TELCIR_07004 [Teladorsagia circumcincta]|nr:hypothetical protein TELCIR_07004 [Teladorsagia circumcincta]
MGDDELMLRGDGAGDDGDNEDADLSLVCSRNGTDKTTFDMMKMISSVTAAEEDSLYSQYNVELSTKTWSKELADLRARSSTVDYDTEKYVRDSIAQMKKVATAVNECLERLEKWKELQAMEAEMSKKVAGNKKK